MHEDVVGGESSRVSTVRAERSVANKEVAGKNHALALFAGESSSTTVAGCAPPSPRCTSDPEIRAFGQ